MSQASHSSEDLFQRLESFNGRNEQLLPDRPDVGCSHAVGEYFPDCPNHVDGARSNVSTALEIVGSRPMPSIPSSLPPTASVLRPSSHAQSFPSHSVYRSHLPTLLPAHNTTVVNADSARRHVLPFASSSQAVPFLGPAPRMPNITSEVA